MIINIPVSLGELIDKISILRIKKINIQSSEKLKFINEELILLEKKLDGLLYDKKDMQHYLDKLISTNLNLWKIENDIRECERQKSFGKKFIYLSREVYFNNDERAKIKLEINQKFESNIVEVKSYNK